MKLRRVAVATVAAVAACTTSVPVASATSHWSRSECRAWVKEFKAKHPHPNSQRVAEANKVLKAWGCPERF